MGGEAATVGLSDCRTVAGRSGSVSESVSGSRETTQESGDRPTVAAVVMHKMKDFVHAFEVEVRGPDRLVYQKVDWSESVGFLP